MGAMSQKRPVNLSLSEEVVSAARRHGVDLSEVAEAALRREVERLDRESVQASMDRTMELWNAFNREGPSVADEFGTL